LGLKINHELVLKQKPPFQMTSFDSQIDQGWLFNLITKIIDKYLNFPSMNAIQSHVSSFNELTTCNESTYNLH
jgi:hypothetical protein